MNKTLATRERTAETARLISPHIRKTPVIEIDGADFGMPGVTLCFKLELYQHSGSFKARGVFANLMLNPPGPAGVTAASGGNHGAAVAYAAQKLGVKARIFVPEISSPAKVARIRRYGQDPVLIGDRYQAAAAACADYAASTGAANIKPFDAPQTILGAATASLEFAAQCPDLDTVFVSVGGGGLIAGASIGLDAATAIIGVEPALAPCFHDALAAGQPVDAPVGGVAADSLGATRIGETAFAVAKGRVANSQLVSDGAILAAQQALWDAMQVAVEPGAATAFAPLHSGAFIPKLGARIGVILCGANTDAVSF